MRTFLILFIFVLSLQSLTKADDISDFEIEGFSVGDSLLDHFKEINIKKEIKSEFSYKYKNTLLDWV